MKYFLGSLEAAIMDVVWSRGPSTVREVMRSLQSHRRLAYTTIMTVMSRLQVDGCLRRLPGTANAYRYEATEDREGFAARCTRENINALVARYGDAALVQFLAKVDKIPADKLQRLKRLASRPRHAS